MAPAASSLEIPPSLASSASTAATSSSSVGHSTSSSIPMCSMAASTSPASSSPSPLASTASNPASSSSIMDSGTPISTAKAWASSLVMVPSSASCSAMKASTSLRPPCLALLLLLFLSLLFNLRRAPPFGPFFPFFGGGKAAPIFSGKLTITIGIDGIESSLEDIPGLLWDGNTLRVSPLGNGTSSLLLGDSTISGELSLNGSNDFILSWEGGILIDSHVFHGSFNLTSIKGTISIGVHGIEGSLEFVHH